MWRKKSQQRWFQSCVETKARTKLFFPFFPSRVDFDNDTTTKFHYALMAARKRESMTEKKVQNEASFSSILFDFHHYSAREREKLNSNIDSFRRKLL
jgi:hypothetical protein